MEQVKRNERIGALIKILTEAPNRIFTLSYFSEMFGAAKSTISEDIDIVRDIFKKYGLGEMETVTGAAGGVKYLPVPARDKALAFTNEMALRLCAPDRILPGGYLYMGDVLSTPGHIERMGEILAAQFYRNSPDFVLTCETMGVPVAMMCARVLNVPMIIARRNRGAGVAEGSVITINYVSASSKRLQTMKLPKRLVGSGQRALIIDDFMKGGGTAKGMIDMMKEFAVTVVGVGVVMATALPQHKLVDNYKSLLVLDEIDEARSLVKVSPAAWLTNF